MKACIAVFKTYSQASWFAFSCNYPRNGDFERVGARVIFPSKFTRGQSEAWIDVHNDFDTTYFERLARRASGFQHFK